MENVEDIYINKAVTDAYMAYAMAVNLGRAIPDLRDGLKPVQRRVILGLLNLSSGKFVKSARVVGEVMGKYHPHGDTSIYDAAISMSRDWGYRMPLIEPQGNNGSISGDNPAAMRYTEMRLSKVLNLDNRTIKDYDMASQFTYDGETVEPLVLPIEIPLILINGARGIGVSISTYIPPFNPNELIKLVTLVLKKRKEGKKITLAETRKIIKGPDFPTAGTVSSPDWDSILSIGKGSITHEVDLYNTVKDIHIRSICTETTATQLINSISNKAKLLGIRNIEDLTSNVIDIKLTYKHDVTGDDIARLYKETLCSVTRKVNMIMTIGGETISVGVIGTILAWITNRESDIIRHMFVKKAHYITVIRGLKVYLIVLDNIDAIVDTIRNSFSTEEAIDGLKELLEIDDYDAEYILSMNLKSMKKLSVRDIKSNLKENEELLKTVGKVLSSSEIRGDYILNAMKDSIDKEIGKRRSIVKEYERTEFKDNNDYLVYISTDSVTASLYNPNTKAKGKNKLLKGHDTIIILTSDGVVYRVKVSNVYGDRRGTPFNLITPREEGVKILYVGVYKEGATFKITLYNSVKEVILPNNLVIGRGGNRLFAVDTKIVRATIKSAK